MGIALWLRVRQGDEIACDQEDYRFLVVYSKELDAIADRLAVQPFGAYCDQLTMEDWARDLAADDLEDQSDEAEPADDGGPAHRIEDYSWFDPGEGLVTAEKLLAFVREDPELFRFPTQPGKSHHRAGLIDELESLQRALAEAAARGEPFHLMPVE